MLHNLKLIHAVNAFLTVPRSNIKPQVVFFSEGTRTQSEYPQAKYPIHPNIPNKERTAPFLAPSGS